jgi:hypothetical protein
LLAPSATSSKFAPLQLSREAVGKTKGIGEKSNDASGEAVKLVVIWLYSVGLPASPHGSLELPTMTCAGADLPDSLA